MSQEGNEKGGRTAAFFVVPPSFPVLPMWRFDHDKPVVGPAVIIIIGEVVGEAAQFNPGGSDR
jgi:hypothetical protein